MTRRGKPTVSVFAALQVLLFGTTAPQTMLLARAQDGSYTGEQIFYSSLTTSGELSTNCSLAVEACTEDAACAECVASISADRFRSRRLYNDAETSYGESEGTEQELCSSRYPLLLTGSAISFCERAGIAYCCQFADNNEASACLAIDSAAQVWDCFLREMECTVQEMPCHPGYSFSNAPTPTPTSDTYLTFGPTSSPTQSPSAASDAKNQLAATPTPSSISSSRGLDMTSSPTLDPFSPFSRTAAPTSSTSVSAGGRPFVASAFHAGVFTVIVTVAFWNGFIEV